MESYGRHPFRQAGSGLKSSGSILERRSSVCFITGTDEGHIEETRQISSLVSARQKRMCLIHGAVKKTLRSLEDSASVHFDVDGIGKNVPN